jgi:hypothetical protein
LAAADFASDDDGDDDEDVAVEEEWADGRVTMMVSRRNARCEGRGDRIMVGLVFPTATPTICVLGVAYSYTWRLCDFLLGVDVSTTSPVTIENGLPNEFLTSS